MKKYYITFGQDHKHEVNGKRFDKDSIASVQADSYMDARKKAFSALGSKWAFVYDDILSVGMEHYPRGIIQLDGGKEGL